MSRSTDEQRYSVMCFGDSNTHGTVPMTDVEDRRRYKTADRWTGVLATRMGPNWNLIEEGHPGRTTVHDDPVNGPHRNGARILPALLETHRPLDLVVIMLGTNDLQARFAVTPYDIAQSLGLLAKIVATSECGPGRTAPAVLLVAPPIIRESGFLAETFTDGARKSATLAARIAATAGRVGASFFDAGGIVASDPVDGVHLSKTAHKKLGDALAEQLGPITEEIEGRHAQMRPDTEL